MLLGTASKHLAGIFLPQLSSAHQSCMRENHADFRQGLDGVDRVFTLQQTLERKHIFRRLMTSVFSDPKTTFDLVILQRCGTEKSNSRFQSLFGNI